MLYSTLKQSIYAFLLRFFRCRHFVYVDVSVYPSVRGETGLTRVGATERDLTQLYPDRSIADKYGVNDLAHLNNQQVNV